MTVASRFLNRQSDAPRADGVEAAQWWARVRAHRGLATIAAPPMTLVAAFALAVIGSVWSISTGSATLYGDARAHLNVARHVSDALTPGLAQLGSVWLPLPHLLLAPLVAIDPLWHSALAGAIVGGACFVFSAVRIHGLTAYWTGSRVAGWVAFALFATSLNLVYLQTTALTEPVLLALLIGFTFHMARWLREMSHRDLAMAAMFALLASLTRYDGWVLLPLGLVIVGLWTRTHERRAHATQANLVIFAVLSGYGLLLWLLYNLIIFGDPLNFVHSGASAQAAQVALAQVGMLQTSGNLVESFLTYGWAMIDVVGPPLLVLGAVGAVVMLARNRGDRWATVALIAILASPIAFNVISLYAGQSTIRVPQRAPYQMWNLRYAILVLPLLAFAAGSLAKQLRPRLAIPIAIVAVPAIALLGTPVVPITLLDGQTGISSAAAGQPEVAARYLSMHYTGGGILADDTSSSPVMFASGLDLREFVTVGFKPYYARAIADPGHNVAWLVVVSGDAVDRAMKQDPGRFNTFTQVASNGELRLYQRG